MKHANLTIDVIYNLRNQGFNGFYIDGLNHDNQFILVPTVLENQIQNDELAFEIFEQADSQFSGYIVKLEN